MSDSFIPIDILEGVEDIAQEIGKSISIRRYVDSDDWVDVTKPSLGKKRTCISCVAQAIMTDYLDSMIDGTMIKQGDRSAVVSLYNISIVPLSTDSIIISNEIWKIIDIRPIEISDVTCVMSVQLRK